ncbi:MAG: Uma2 family endonuclease [Spirosomataceae bacterium]
METLVLTPSEYEVERGKPMPSKNHSFIQANLVFELTVRYREQYRFGSEMSLRLDDWAAVPDVCIYPTMPLDILHDEISMTTPPLCTVEILSPTQSLTELITKAEKYLQLGVQSCWLVIPEFKNIYVFDQHLNYEIYRAHDTLQDPVLSISLPLQGVFV